MKGWQIALLAMALVASGCSKKQVTAPPSPMEGEKGGPGAMLAYEHSLDIDLDREQIGPRIAALREACVKHTFGDCNVISISETERGGSLKLRVVPDGVERMATLAAQGGKVSSRQTRAEDIGKAVHDTQRDQAEAEAYSKRLDELSARKDLSVTDLIALTREQANVAEKRRALETMAATQQMRLDTNLLTFEFLDPSYAGRGALGGLWENMVDQTKEGIGEALPAAAYCLPFVILAFPTALLWWALWRRATRRWRRTP
ncbi:MAG: DUF4349 domain-containing protein [Luteibacter sp.]